MRATILGLALLSSYSAAAPPRMPEYAWACHFARSFRCTPTGNCEAIEPRSAAIVEVGTYVHCDVTPACDGLGDATFTVNGDFLIAHSSERAEFAEISPSLAITEVDSRGDAIFVSYGQCQDGPPIVMMRPPNSR